MENKKSFGEKLESFFAGKGFYIVLFLCVAVIGVSVWAMLAGTGTDVDDPLSNIAVNAPVAEATKPPVINDRETAKTPKTPEKDEVPEKEDDPIASEPEDNEPEEETDAIQPEPPQQETPVWTEDEPVPVAPVTFIWPVAGEVEIPYSVTSLIYNRTMGDWRTHDGIDVAADLGAQVMAVASGRVENIYTDDHYGVTVIIDHMGGLKSVYSNLAEVPTVYVGDSIMSGEVIGAIGRTALCEASEVTHLHFKMTLDGASVDPLEYLM